MPRENFRLTPQEILLIRESPLGPSELARQLGVGKHSVSRIRQGKTYANGAVLHGLYKPSKIYRGRFGNIPPEMFDVPLKRRDQGGTLRERIALYCGPPSGPLGCIEWQGAYEKGRPVMQVEQAGKFFAYRLVWMMLRGPIGLKQVIRHYVCNNPRCVNVDHLLTGTREQNVHDRVKDHTVPLGAKNWNAKLTEDIVRRVRAPSVDLRSISKELGISYNTLYSARIGLSWKYFTDPPPQHESMRQVGEKVHTAKLTAEKVREIRASTETISELSRRYGVSRPTIRAVKSGESWKSEG